MESKKCGSLSKEQKRALVQYMEDHPELKCSKFTKDFTYKKGKQLWEEVASNLNSMPGANKNWEKWRKTWHDIKNSVKGKTAIIRRHSTQTGGGPPIDMEITEEDQKILDLIAPVTIDGMPEVQESEAVFEVINDQYIEPVSSDLFNSVDKTETKLIDVHTSELSNSVGNTGIKLNTTQNINAVPSSSKKFKIVKTPTRVRRLERSTAASERMAKLMENRNEVYTKYVNEKLELMKQQCEAGGRIATALEIIADAMKRE